MTDGSFSRAASPAGAAAAARGDPRLAYFVELTKPGITRLVLLTTGVGYFLGAGARVDLFLLHVLLGVGLAASGTNALNQVVERDIDRLMNRTRERPLPAGRISPRAAALFAGALCVGGIGYLALAVNAVTALVVTATLAIYILVYTPLKRRTSLSTLVGAVPGALPIVAGWTGAGAALGVQAWSLFWILFLWQIPHFLALAYLYRDDYRRAGFVMLSLDDEGGRMTSRQALLYGLTLLPVSLLPTLLGVTGSFYFFGALAAGVAFLWPGLRLTLDPTDVRASRLFLSSVLYLPALLLLMVADRAL